METINNVASAAAKVVWGSPDSNQEPVSGVKGNTAKGQPYDAGNMEPEEVKKLATPGEDKPYVEHLDTNATSESSAKNVDVASPVAVGKPENQGTDNTSEHASKANAAPGDHLDARHPTFRLEENPVPEADLKKPGPKPLDVVAREHGGDAGNVGTDSNTTQTSSDDGPKQTSRGEGTGEKFIKSTGFAAEGGDFDAANAGAGREADRLIEEHNNSPTTGGPHKHNDQGVTKQSSNNSNGSGEKKSFKEKIKAKLHMH